MTYLIGLILTFNLVSNQIGNLHISGALIAAVFATLYVERTIKGGWFRAYLDVIVGAIIFGYSVQIFGEVVGGWITSDWAISLLLFATIVISARPRNPLGSSGLKQRSKVTVLAAIWTASVALWSLLLSLRMETLTHFLGYGYDNVGHLAQAKLIRENGGTTLMSSGIETWPNYLQDSAQASSSLISTFSSIAGVETNYELVAVYTAVTVLLPLAVLIGPSLALFSRGASRLQIIIVTVFSILVVSTGYLSRIWLSGYLASNLATVIILLFACSVATRSPTDFKTATTVVATIAFIYPLYAPISLMLLVPDISRYARGLWPKRSLSLSQFLSDIATPLLLSPLVLLPIMATRRSYGGSHFLVDGGVEPLPLLHLLVAGLFFVIAPCLLLPSRFPLGLMIAVPALIGSLVVCTYSLVEIGRISYYPTKIVITLVITALTVTVIEWLLQEGNSARRVATNVVTSFLASYMFLQPSGTVFVGGYMGQFSDTIRSIASFRPEATSTEANVLLAEMSAGIDAPILYLPAYFDSELDTRWINTLSGKWSDSSWSAWKELRQAVSVADWNTGIEIMSSTDLVVVTEDPIVHTEIGGLYPSRVCIYTDLAPCYIIETSDDRSILP